MRTAIVVVVVLAVLVWAAPYIVGLVLAGAIVHKAGKLRRDAQARYDHRLWQDAMRRQAGPLYTGVNNPSSPAWFDNNGGCN